MIIRRMERDDFVAIFIRSKFIDEHPITLDVTIATTPPLSMQRMIVMFGIEFLFPNKLPHQFIDLPDAMTAGSQKLPIIAPKAFRQMNFPLHSGNYSFLREAKNSSSVSNSCTPFPARASLISF